MKCSILDHIKQKDFATIYEEVTASFKSKNGFIILKAQKCGELKWPDEIGVYVVRKIKTNEVIYIGMTGSFSQKGQLNTKQRLSSRPDRWNPYRFEETGVHKDKFLYGPDYKKHEDRSRRPSNYLYEIPIAEVEIDCFLLNGEDRLAPAFVEGLLIQAYLQENGCLPTANNKF